MIAHQLDLFGGPLKPPKKIKVDDYDTTVDEPKPIEPQPEAEAEPEIAGEPEITAEDPHFAQDGIASNAAEWVAAAEEEPAVTGLAYEPMPDGQPAITEDGPGEGEHTAEAYPGETMISEDDARDADAEIAIAEEDNEEQESPAAEPAMSEIQDVEEENEEPTDAMAVAVEENTTAHATAPFKIKKTADESEDGLNIPPDEELFKRQYYSMRETSAMFGVNQSLLRFWENEFDILQPKKNKKGDRYFRPVDIKNLVMIYNLLRVRKFTLEGAKDYLTSNKKAADTFELVKRLEKLKAFLLELKAGL